MRRSKSFNSFQDKTKEIFSFAVVVTASVPALKEAAAKYKKKISNRLPDPSHFEPSVTYEIFHETIEKLRTDGIDESRLKLLSDEIGEIFGNTEFKNLVIRILGEQDYKTHRNTLKKQSEAYITNLLECSKGYQTKLATYLYFSLFSYFESFIIEISKEVIESLKYENSKKYITKYSESLENKNARIKLSKPFDSRKLDRYKKFSGVLRDEGYKSPKDILFSSLIMILASRIEHLKATDIPNFLENTFHLELSPIEKQFYHSVRQNRNSIGHGKKSFSPTIGDVINTNKFFKSLSKKIDEHIVQHYLELPNFI